MTASKLLVADALGSCRLAGLQYNHNSGAPTVRQRSVCRNRTVAPAAPPASQTRSLTLASPPVRASYTSFPRLTAAVTRCYPGPSPNGRGDRVPSPKEQETCAVWLDEELRIIRPKLLIPVGRLAITRFLPNLPLDELIGRMHDVTHVGGRSLAIPLPHPSGASSWIHMSDHPRLLERALDMIGRELQRLGIGAGPSARSVA